jgi:hypothetical protein
VDGPDKPCHDAKLLKQKENRHGPLHAGHPRLAASSDAAGRRKNDPLISSHAPSPE